MNNTKPLKMYDRICERCNKQFKATGKFCTVCNECNKSILRWKKK